MGIGSKRIGEVSIREGLNSVKILFIFKHFRKTNRKKCWKKFPKMAKVSPN